MDEDTIRCLIEIFQRGIKFGNALETAVNQSPHFKEYTEAYEIYQDMASLDDFTEYDLLNTRRAIRLLNSVDRNDKLYLQFQALFLNALLYAMLSHYDKSYECLDKIEAMDDGSIFTLKRKNIKEIKESISQFRKVVQDAEEQWKKEKEAEAKTESEKKAKEEELYNKIVRIDESLQAIKDGITAPDGKDDKRKRHDKLLLRICVASVVLSAIAIVLHCVMLFD